MVKVIDKKARQYFAGLFISFKSFIFLKPWSDLLHFFVRNILHIVSSTCPGAFILLSIFSAWLLCTLLRASCLLPGFVYFFTGCCPCIIQGSGCCIDRCNILFLMCLF